MKNSFLALIFVFILSPSSFSQIIQDKNCYTKTKTFNLIHSTVVFSQIQLIDGAEPKVRFISTRPSENLELSCPVHQGYVPPSAWQRNGFNITLKKEKASGTSLKIIGNESLRYEDNYAADSGKFSAIELSNPQTSQKISILCQKPMVLNFEDTRSGLRRSLFKTSFSQKNRLSLPTPCTQTEYDIDMQKGEITIVKSPSSKSENPVARNSVAE